MSNDFFEVPRGETLEDKRARYRDMIVGDIPGFIDEHCGRYPVIWFDLKATHRVPFCCKELSYTDSPFPLFNHQDIRARDEARFHRDLSDVLHSLLRRFPEIDEDVRKKVEKEEAKKEVGKKADEEVDKKTEAANRIRLLSGLKAELDEKRELMKTKITTCTGILKSLV
ncbi:hypothetical protein EV182_008831, partial [Spiromyces aspiralis]